MNPYKLNWYLESQDIHTGVKSADHVNDDFQHKQLAYDAIGKMWNQTWYNPKNLYNTYNTPIGGLFVDVVLGITVPTVAIGRKAKKIIELGRYFHDTLNESV